MSKKKDYSKNDIDEIFYYSLCLDRSDLTIIFLSTVDGGFGITSPSSIVNATASSPGVRLRIVTDTGEDISGTRLGEKLFLR